MPYSNEKPNPEWIGAYGWMDNEIMLTDDEERARINATSYARKPEPWGEAIRWAIFCAFFGSMAFGIIYLARLAAKLI